MLFCDSVLNCYTVLTFLAAEFKCILDRLQCIGTHVTGGNSHVFQRQLTVPCTALTASKLTAVSAVQRDCETVQQCLPRAVPGVFPIRLLLESGNTNKQELSGNCQNKLTTNRYLNAMPSCKWAIHNCLTDCYLNSAVQEGKLIGYTVQVWERIRKFAPHFIMNQSEIMALLIRS